MLYPASDMDWRFNSYMIVYMFQCHSPKSSHPLPLPLSPKVCYTHLCLFYCLAYRVDVVILSFYSSRAQLLPLSWSLKCLGKTKIQFTLLDNLQLFSSGAHLSYLMASTQTQPGEREKGWEISWEKLSWTFVFWIDWIIFFSIFLTMQHGMWDVSSPTRDGTCVPCNGITES